MASSQAFKREPLSPSMPFDSPCASPPSPYERWAMDSAHSVVCVDGDSSVADDPIVTYRRLNLELTCTPSPHSRLARQPLAQPQHTSKPNPSFAIPAHNQYNIALSRQDERTVNPSPSPLTPSTSIGHDVSSFDNRSLSLNYVSLNQSSRLRTSTQVFRSTSDLAAHYGIPQFLPPVPCTTPRSSSTPEKQSDSTLEDDFSTLCSDYLNMLSQPTDDTGADDSHVVSPVTAPQDVEAVNALMEVLAASPEFRDASNALGEYMTSPFDSPFDEFLTTPLTTDSADVNANIFSPDLPLFSDCFLDVPAEAASPIKDDAEFSGELYTMSPQQPITPSLDPQSLYASPEIATLPLSSPSLPPSLPPRRKSNVTGTRKNITPESLVPIDAPTQPRHYVTPSVTSRKDLPVTFARKRARYQTPQEEEDELSSDVYVLPPNPTEAQLIEAKRRQNTIAARRSRKRKLEYQRELESAKELLEEEKEHWKLRALTYEELLKRHGLEVPLFDS